MNCDEAARLIPLYLYGELEFEEEERFESHLDGCEPCRAEVARQRKLHTLFDSAAGGGIEDGMLTGARLELRARLKHESAAHRGWWAHFSELFGVRFAPAPAMAQVAGAVALVAIGFFGARVAPLRWFGSNSGNVASIVDPAVSRVRYVEPVDANQVRIVIDETQRRTLSGSVLDEPIRKLLIVGTRDSDDPGVRVQSVELLKSQCGSADIRNTLLYALQHDPNAGVRLKALDGLKQFAADPETKQVLTRVLLTDANPGVRTQVVDLLVQHREDEMVGVLQELLSRENNGYIRQRCERALHDMNASPETY